MHFLTGTIGITSIQGVEAIPAPTPASEIIKIAIQIVIGFITVWKMVKKPKVEKSTNENSQN